MPILLTARERKIAEKLAEIKKLSGSHSPSPAMLALAGVTVKYDFCYLSNPYATDLFLGFWKKDLRNTGTLRAVIERYPSQNRALAEKVAKFLKTTHPLFISPSKEGERVVGAENIFVGNGASEIIQAVLHNFVKRKMLVCVPTFSPYLEFAPSRVQVIHHQLKKEKSFALDVKAFLKQVRAEKPDTVVIINPNNPDGGYLDRKTIQALLKDLRSVPTVILDESFLHFAEKSSWVLNGFTKQVEKFPKLVVIKSLSKDFGFAGVRLGYAIMSESRVSALLSNGFLWNVSGFGEYALGVLARKDFRARYERARLKSIHVRDEFYKKLSKIRGLTVYKSKANFFLTELNDGSLANDLMVALLSRYGIYVRPCGDKVGLHGEFVRIASRTSKENALFIRAISQVFYR